MRFQPSVRDTLLAGFLFLLPLWLPAQQQPELAALRQALIGQTLTIKVQGVHAAGRGLAPPIDTRIVAGVVQKRGIDILRGKNDAVLPPGTAVQVVKVEGATETRDDILRIGVNIQSVGYASLAFVADRGFLAGMTPAQALALLSPVLDGASLTGIAQPTGNASSDSALSLAKTPVPPSLPATPLHPANTVVDMPPAAPGYPPLHASRAAEEGCWWAPVLIEKYKLEFLKQECLPHRGGFGDDPFEYVADKTGVAMGLPGHPGDHILEVVEKPAEQSIATAIRQKFIAKLDPAARANCNARRQSSETGPVETYQALPSGAYARQARFNRGDDSSDDPCPGLAGNDAVSMYFQYTPSNSKTHYVYWHYQDEIPLEERSLRFFTGDGAGDESETGTQTRTPTAATKRVAAPEGTPQRGVWSFGPKADGHDVGRDAATSAGFEMNSGAEPRPSAIAVGCNGDTPGRPHLELRGIFPVGLAPPVGFIGVRGRLLLPGVSQAFTPALVHLGSATAILVPLDAADAAALALDGDVAREGIKVIFGVGISFTADLPVRNAALEAVLESCHLPSAPLAAALAPEQVRHLSLARVALGMSVEDVRQALGSSYQYTAQANPRYPELSFLAAWGNDSAYSFTMLDGKVAGFQFAHTFGVGARPSEDNVVAGVSSKTWQPIIVRPAMQAFWVSNAEGQPQMRRTIDNSVHPCARVATSSPGPPPAGQIDNRSAAHMLQRVMPSDYKEECGVTIEMQMHRPSPNNGEVESVQVSVANDIAFRQFMQVVKAAAQNENKARQDKLNSIPTPF